jgi:hypothetical protein
MKIKLTKPVNIAGTEISELFVIVESKTDGSRTPITSITLSKDDLQEQKSTSFVFQAVTHAPLEHLAEEVNLEIENFKNRLSGDFEGETRQKLYVNASILEELFTTFNINAPTNANVVDIFNGVLKQVISDFNKLQEDNKKLFEQVKEKEAELEKFKKTEVDGKAVGPTLD